MPLNHDIPLPVRLGQLINNEFTADVFFEVGSQHKLMYGHRSILSVGSPVFNAQLNGDFKEARNNSRQHPIVVTDVEVNVFEQILHHIYSDDAVVNQANVVDVYYAAEKYLLAGLSRICEDFFRNDLNKGNVVKILNENQKHSFKVVNDACLDIICDDPLVFFSEYHDYLALMHFRAFELILSSDKINCLKDDLLRAISDWERFHANENTKRLRSIVNCKANRSLKCSKLHGFADLCTVDSHEFCLNIKTNKWIAIYGVGVYVSGPGLEGESAYISVLAEVKTTGCPDDVCEISYGEACVEIQEDLHVQEIVFRKVVIEPREECSIHININLDAFDFLPIFGLRQFRPYNLPPGLKLAITNENTSREFATNGYNCVAYLLYNLM